MVDGTGRGMCDDHKRGRNHLRSVQYFTACRLVLESRSADGRVSAIALLSRATRTCGEVLIVLSIRALELTVCCIALLDAMLFSTASPQRAA